MPFTVEIQRLIIGCLIAFGMVALVSTYWVVTGEPILTREDNPRLVEATARIMRGGIYDRNNAPLVETNPTSSGRVVRTYHHPSMYSALGYYSMRYGEGGAEAAFNDILTGDPIPADFTTWFERNLLHYPQAGSDVQLTLDLNIQQAAWDALEGRDGALVVLSVPDGAVKAIISNPTFNPNELDTRWESFTQDAGEPFFNRVLQGNYQPGAMMYSLLVLTALIDQFPADTAFADASRPVTAGNVTLNCVQEPPADLLTIFDALTFGCPAPFADFAESIGYDAIQRTLRLIRPSNQPTLRGFIGEPTPPETVPTQIGLNEALGQGIFRMTPLEMAMVMAAFINNGNAPQPFILNAIRPPKADTWDSVRELRPTTPITTTESARRLTALLRQNVARGTAQAAARDELDIGGQAALGYSGEGTHVWFAGFVRTEVRRGYVVALVLENSADLELAARIGGDVLQAAVADAP